MTDSSYRPLSQRERALLDFLLAVEFPGVRELRRQAQSVHGRLWNGLPGIVEFKVTDPEAPAAKVSNGVPVEAEARNPDSAHELLLHVKHGYLDSLELVTYDDDEPTELPEPAELDQPFVHAPRR